MSWMAFDSQDARALSDRGIECGIAGAGSLRRLATAAESVVIAPGMGNSIVVARCRSAVYPAKKEAAKSQGFASSGILGLDGDAVYLDELPQPNPWWKRIF